MQAVNYSKKQRLYLDSFPKKRSKIPHINEKEMAVPVSVLPPKNNTS